MKLCTKLNNVGENHFETWDKNCALRVCLRFIYFAETENFLLKVS